MALQAALSFSPMSEPGDQPGEQVQHQILIHQLFVRFSIHSKSLTCQSLLNNEPSHLQISSSPGTSAGITSEVGF